MTPRHDLEEKENYLCRLRFSINILKINLIKIKRLLGIQKDFSAFVAYLIIRNIQIYLI